jgi:hypothetical protein
MLLTLHDLPHQVYLGARKILISNQNNIHLLNLSIEFNRELCAHSQTSTIQMVPTQ